MRRIIGVSLALLVCLAGTNAFAGRIFGDIKMGGKPVAAGLKLSIALAPPAAAPETAKEAAPAAPSKAAPAALDTTRTDKFGSYKLSVKEEGKCMLTLMYEKQPVSLEVFSYKEPTRYDLILEKKDGQLSLRRK